MINAPYISRLSWPFRIAMGNSLSAHLSRRTNNMHKFRKNGRISLQVWIDFFMKIGGVGVYFDVNLVKCMYDLVVSWYYHEDVMICKHFPCYWPFVWGTLPVAGGFLWPRAGNTELLVFYLMYAGAHSWTNCGVVGDFGRHWCDIPAMTHYNCVILDTIASQITSLTIVYSIVYSDADQRKHQSSAPLAFVWGIHRGPVNSPHKWPVTRNMFPFHDVIMHSVHRIYYHRLTHCFVNYCISFRLISICAITQADR